MQTVKDDEVKLYADFDNRQRVQSVGQKRAPGKTIPVIDSRPIRNGGSLEERKRVARALHDTCIDTGFFYLANHGISEAEIDIAHEWGRLFFELPRECESGLQLHAGRRQESQRQSRQGDRPERDLHPAAAAPAG